MHTLESRLSINVYFFVASALDLYKTMKVHNNQGKIHKMNRRPHCRPQVLPTQCIVCMKIHLGQLCRVLPNRVKNHRVDSSDVQPEGQTMYCGSFTRGSLAAAMQSS